VRGINKLLFSKEPLCPKDVLALLREAADKKKMRGEEVCRPPQFISWDLRSSRAALKPVFPLMELQCSSKEEPEYDCLILSMWPLKSVRVIDNPM